MNYRMLGYVLGRIFMVEAACCCLRLLWLLFMASGAACLPLWVTAVGLACWGLVAGAAQPANTAIYAREGLVIVALAGC